MAPKNKRKNKHKTPKVLNRKELRKEKRKQKKINRNEYYTNRNKPGKTEQLETESDNSAMQNKKKGKSQKQKLEIAEIIGKTTKVISTEEQRIKEKKAQKNVERQMQKQRKEQLLHANIVEDKNIKKLEKQLKLHKRKTKTIPKSFTVDGLDYLLEVCDSDIMMEAVAAEKQLNDVNNEFEEDFALMEGKTIAEVKKQRGENSRSSIAESATNISEYGEYSEDESSDSDSEHQDSKLNKSSLNRTDVLESDNEFEELLNEDIESDSQFEEYEDEDLEELNGDDSEEFEGEEEINQIIKNEKKTGNKTLKSSEGLTKRKFDDSEDSNKSIKKLDKKNKRTKKEKESKYVSKDESFDDLEDTDDLKSDSYGEISTIKGATKINPDGTWEDIYGRLRHPDGSIAMKTEQRYIPPAVREKMNASTSQDKKKIESLHRLRKQLHGLLNRLAESNMHNIATQIESLYMNNSRNDMNDTLTSLILESVVSNVITPERLLMEHVLLVTILHANIGTEVGAHFLQAVITKYDEFSNSIQEVENKSLDNIVNVLAQLYNFKLFDAKLLYEILEKLTDRFQEKDVECILHILRSVGFSLRKEDPLALKNLILNLQKQAASTSEEHRDNARVKFMLDILLAIKNNNVTKIPNYDTSHSEHLKKIMKGFIRKGNYVTQLNISLNDLLKAEERGKWWVVGSAWTGNLDANGETKTEKKSDGFSAELLELARKQRMNTDTRRNIFCILMTAEDYLDSFEKLLRLGLKNQQEREIIHVILHCCLQEKEFNPYYAVLAQKFCDYDRKYQMTIKYSVWDKLKTLNSHSGLQISNLAKLLTHLFIEKGLSISALKIVQFSELDQVTLRFMRLILIGILLHKDMESVQEIFLKVGLSDKLKMFRESLRLFIHHFLLRNLTSENIPKDRKELLEQRAKIVERVLTAKEGRVKF